LPTPSEDNFGYYWICDIGGMFGGVTYNPKDWAVSHGDRWDHVDNSDPTLAMMGCGYTSCATAAGTAAKATDTVAGFVRTVGGRVSVAMANGNTAASPTLNVSGTGAAAIRFNGAAPSADMLPPGIIADYVWDGTYWQLDNPAPTYASVALTLAAASWAGSAAPYTYTITTTAVRITATSLQSILPNTADMAVLQAASDASILADNSLQATDTIVLKAYGDKPAVDIPVLLVSQSDRG
jgi:hypothetical protein